MKDTEVMSLAFCPCSYIGHLKCIYCCIFIYFFYLILYIQPFKKKAHMNLAYHVETFCNLKRNNIFAHPVNSRTVHIHI